MRSYKAGDEVIYQEDGGILRCRVLAYEQGDNTESAKLQVIEVIAPCPFDESNPGEDFDVFHRTDICFGGDWRMMPADEADIHRYRAPDAPKG